jgi:hypothetical protein
MSYIGRQPTIGNFQICDAISTVNNQAAYTMQVGSVNVSPESANHMIVSLNGVIQKPTDAFTVSGSTITFASNLVTGDVINFIQILGNVLDLGVPSDDTVTAAKLSSNAVTTAKILDANVTTAKIADANVTLAKLSATGTKNSTTFLRGDNTFAEAGGGQFEFVSRTAITSDVGQVVFNNLTANTYHKFVLQGIDSDNNGGEDFCMQFSSDNGSSYQTGSNYRWTYFQTYSSGNTNCTGSTSGTSICMFDGFHTSDVDEGIFAEIMLSHVGNSQKPIAYWKGAHMSDSSNKIRSTDGGGMFESAMSLNAIKMFFDSGNINGGSNTFITHYKGIIS